MNTEYLKESVGKYLREALCEVAKRRPERPIEFLAYYLISLYERDLQLQRSEKTEEEPEDKEESEEDRIISQMFRERLSIAFPRDKEASPVETPSSSDISRMFRERLSIAFPRGEDVSPAPTSSSCTLPFDVEDAAIDEEKLSASGVAVSKDKEEEEEDDSSELKTPHIRARKLSVFAEEPVTEEELKETGASDPFLARRATNVFDENFSPIGNPQP